MLSLADSVRIAIAPSFWYGFVKARTVQEYLRAITLYIELIGDLPINKINGFNNARFVQKVQQTHLKPWTIKKYIVCLNTIFSKLGPPGPKNRDAFGWLPEAPWIRLPTSYKKLPREIEDTEVDRLFKAAASCPECFDFPRYLDDRLRPRWWEALILLVSTTALRRGVLLGLTWEDLDIPGRKIAIPNHLDKCKSERIKPLHPKVLQHLRAIQSVDDRHLLPWKHGNHKFDDIITALNEHAGITPKLTLHDMKRYALQSALREGADVSTIMLLGDHSSFKTTTQHYVRASLDNYVENMRLPGMDEEEVADD